PIRIAMWSGPRNLSTAMMRSFGNRADCAVIDEPYYAAYLKQTGFDHPMREAVLAAQETDWREVEARILGPVPEGAPIFYQKHMSHHMLPGFGRDWFAKTRHAILIRAPERVLASYAAKREAVTAEDIGMADLEEIRQQATGATGKEPPIIEAEDIRRNPEGLLGALCQALDIPFDPAMLAWPPGRRDSDGVWAAHWYATVDASTGFSPPEDGLPDLPDDLQAIADETRPIFKALASRKLRA
ncbi:MAG: HAD family hydrolase, partial [Pseudomonadota bacterium]